MSERKIEIKLLLKKIEELSQRQSDFNLEIYDLRKEILKLKEEENNKIFSSEETALPIKNKEPNELKLPSIPDAAKITEEIKLKGEISDIIKNVENKLNENNEKQISLSKKPISNQRNKPPKNNKFSNWEDFLGRNLIGKLAIVILLLGIGFLTKHVIDNQLINPLTRVIIGYIISSILVGLALKWKPKYEQLSAIVLTGALSSLFFITYAAYDFYSLFGQKFAFALMLVFTTFGMFSSHIYNRKALAYISIIGSFAIPLLLSNNSGNFKVLFTYLLILDIGILAFGLYKKWFGIALGSFLFTWIFYIGWFVMDYNDPNDFYPAWLFSFLFFSVYYIGFLNYYTKVKFNTNLKTVVASLAIGLNAFIFYLYGLNLLHESVNFKELKGLYTLINAIIHFVAFYYVKKKNSEDKTLFYVIAGLVITFITIAVPVQLDGYFVTLIWFIEACIFFFIGRYKKLKMFEIFAYPLVLLGLLSLFDDWNNYSRASEFVAVWNEQFLTNFLVVIAVGILSFIAIKKPSNLNIPKNLIQRLFLILLVVLGYNLFYTEINNYFALQHKDNIENMVSGTAISWFHKTWNLSYSHIYLGALLLINKKIYKNKIVSKFLIVIAGISIFAYLVIGLYAISEIREDYLEYAQISMTNFFGIRYLTLAIFGGLIYLIYTQKKVFPILNSYFEIFLHIVLLWLLSSELIHWLDVVNAASNYRFGLTILWGIYALAFLIYRGIKNKKVILRISGFALFGITLIKLFLYDLQNLETIQKTIAFISVGILLLVVSYLYNKNKTDLFGDENNEMDTNTEDHEK